MWDCSSTTAEGVRDSGDLRAAINETSAMNVIFTLEVTCNKLWVWPHPRRWRQSFTATRQECFSSGSVDLVAVTLSATIYMYSTRHGWLVLCASIRLR